MGSNPEDRASQISSVKNDRKQISGMPNDWKLKSQANPGTGGRGLKA